MTSRRNLLQYLAASFTLPLPVLLVEQASALVPVYDAADTARRAADRASETILRISHDYMLPDTDSGQVQIQALAIWRDTTRMRGELTGNDRSLTSALLRVEAQSAIIVGHVFAERGDFPSGRAWLRRAGDAAAILPDETGPDLAAHAMMLTVLDTGLHLSDPTRAHAIASNSWSKTMTSIHAPGAGSARALSAAVVARCRALLGPENNVSTLEALNHAGQWAELTSEPNEPLSLFAYTPRSHHYTAAAVCAQVGETRRSREHRQAYLSAPGKPGHMNVTLLDLNDVQNTYRHEGPDAAAAQVHETLDRVPAGRMSAPVRDKAISLTNGLVNATQNTGIPPEVAQLRVYVDRLVNTAYLSAQA